ncbi:hypothetical protein AMTRI_Chr12g237760 [Amborella trichopoda]
MLCACSGEQFKFEEVPQSPESLATRDFSASALSSRTWDWDSRFEESQLEDVECTLKEALSLNYEEARALLGRLEYQRGNFSAALQVFQGIDIRGIAPRMSKSIAERPKRKKGKSKSEPAPTNVMSMHSVSLLLEAILLKAKSLEGLGRYKDAARECKTIIDTVESALPNGIQDGFIDECKMQDMFHKALESLPKLWKQAGLIEEAIFAYRRVLIKPWNLDPISLAAIQRDLAAVLLYSGIEASPHPDLQTSLKITPMSNTEEAILLLLLLMTKVASQEIPWDQEIFNHLTFALSVAGLFEPLSDHIEQIFPGVHHRADRWYLLALCYSARGEDEVALNLLKKSLGPSEKPNHLPSLLLAAKLCSQNPKLTHEGINFGQRAIDCSKDDHRHGVAHFLLGVNYGKYARHGGVSDTERKVLQGESLKSLQKALLTERQDPYVILCLGLENAVQRNLTEALDNVTKFLEVVGGSLVEGWRLLALVLSAEQQFKDAETIVDIALDETEKDESLRFLRLKAMLQISEGQPSQAIEIYRTLLTLVQAQREKTPWKTDMEVGFGKNFEMKAWHDLAGIYTRLGMFSDACVCVDKAKSISFYSPMNWHATGELFDSQSLHGEALIAFSIALSIDPDHVPSMISMAKALRQHGKKSLAIARSFLMNALRLQPTNHEAWLNLGIVSKMEGSLQQAADCFQASYELKLLAPVQDFD